MQTSAAAVIAEQISLRAVIIEYWQVFRSLCPVGSFPWGGGIHTWKAGTFATISVCMMNPEVFRSGKLPE